MGPTSAACWSGKRRHDYRVDAPFMCGHGMVVDVVVAELGALVVGVLEEPDGLVAAPETMEPIPSPNPNDPPTTPSASRILLKGFFIWTSPSGEAAALPHPESSFVLHFLHAVEHVNI